MQLTKRGGASTLTSSLAVGVEGSLAYALLTKAIQTVGEVFLPPLPSAGVQAGCVAISIAEGGPGW